LSVTLIENNATPKKIPNLIQQNVSRIVLQSDNDSFRLSEIFKEPDRIRPSWYLALGMHLDNVASIGFNVVDQFPLIRL